MKIIEVSSEAAHKVGGIYTVLKSKAGEMVKRFGEDYLLIGMYEPHSFNIEVEETKPPEGIKRAMESMEKLGVKCYYGKWTKGDDARIIMLDPYNFVNKMEGGDKKINRIKYELWKKYAIESLWSPYDFELNAGWAWTAGIFIEKYRTMEKEKTIAHFHEWMAGAGLLYLKSHEADVKTVFTTHATTLGRTKASMEEDFMNEVMQGIKNKETVDGRDAYKYKLESKHLLEKACAQKTDIFTTVSEITGKECKYVLGKAPDIITPNGVDLSDFPDKKLLRKKHWASKDKISNFLYSMFLPYYKIMPEESLFFYISGRYEYRNKGIDIFIRGLAKLNEELKSKNSKKQVFAFVLVPTNISGPKKDILENVLIMDDIGDNIDQFLKQNKDLFVLEKMERVKKEEEYLRKLKHQIIQEIGDGSISKKDYKNNENVKNAVELFKNLKKNQGPEKTCYNITYKHDKVLEELESLGLQNREEDNVKVIFYGTYVKPGDGFINLGYYDAVAGCDAGFFPSRYEPWGYTPIEAATQKSIAITSDLAGFGCFLRDKVGDTRDRGIKVLKVSENGDSIKEITSMMSGLVHMGEGEIEELKKDALKMASLTTWSELIKKYMETYEMVLNGKK